jgi:hypothetical protein
LGDWEIRRRGDEKAFVVPPLGGCFAVDRTGYIPALPPKGGTTNMFHVER